MNKNKPGGYTRHIIEDRLLNSKPKYKKCAIVDCNNNVGKGNYFLCDFHHQQAGSILDDEIDAQRSMRKANHL